MIFNNNKKLYWPAIIEDLYKIKAFKVVKTLNYGRDDLIKGFSAIKLNKTKEVKHKNKNCFSTT